jgi:hypothetical protein
MYVWNVVGCNKCRTENQMTLLFACKSNTCIKQVLSININPRKSLLLDFFLPLYPKSAEMHGASFNQ